MFCGLDYKLVDVDRSAGYIDRLVGVNRLEVDGSSSKATCFRVDAHPPVQFYLEVLSMLYVFGFRNMLRYN